MSTATDINSLPIIDNNSKVSKPVQNVSFDIKENNNQQPNIEPNMTMQLSADDLNKIVSGIQQASQSNLTALPARDIPSNNTQITMDEESFNPNYIPQESNNDYINNNSNYEEIMKQQYHASKAKASHDEVVDELQTPLLISILFFIFQLPVIRNAMISHLPMLFLKDGNLALSGILFKSLLFGLSYYISQKFIDMASNGF